MRVTLVGPRRLKRQLGLGEKVVMYHGQMDAGVFLDELLYVARGIDAIVNGLAQFTGLLGEGVRRLQTGMTRHYALAIFTGVVVVVGYFVIRSLVG